MTIIWFNGPSGVELMASLPRQPFEIGCNLIQNNRDVDVVCAYDVDTVSKIEIKPNTEYYTREEAAHSKWNIINDHIIKSTNSGLLACYVAKIKKQFPIYILGCDWGLTKISIFEKEYMHTKPQRKYWQAHKKFISTLFDGLPVYVVNDQQPDINLPIISVKQFISAIQINNNSRKDLQQTRKDL